MAAEHGITSFGTERAVPDGLPQGGPHPGRRPRPVARCAASAPPAPRCPRTGSSGSTRRCATTCSCPRSPGGTDVCSAFVGGSVLLPGALRGHRGAVPRGEGRGAVADGRAAGGGAGRARDQRAAAVDAGGVLGRRRRLPLPGRLLRALPRPLAPRRLDHDRGRRLLRHLRSLRRHPQPGWRAPRHRRTSTRWSRRFDEVVDSLVVHLDDPEGGPGELLLFVVLAPGRRARRRPASAHRQGAADRSCRPATCPTRSTPCQRCPGRCRARSSRCR